MDKRDNPFFYYAELDSQRLKDTFFSPPKKKRKKKTHKKKLLIALPVAFFILAVSVFFLTKYDFMVIARQIPEQYNGGISLLSKDMLESTVCIAKDRTADEERKYFIYLTIPKRAHSRKFNIKTC